MFNEEKLQQWLKYMAERPDEFPAYVSWFHGVTHWEHVEKFGLMMAKECPSADTDVIRWFAYIHDCRRGTEGWCEEHGRIAAKFIAKIRNTFLSDLSDEQITILRLACRSHTVKRRTKEITADICLDADRLDLYRVGIEPDPKLMASEIGKRYAEIPYEELTKKAKI